jgi:hypothetical protein
MGTAPAGPAWLQWWSAAMAGLSFVSSIASTWMVGSVAFPLYGPTSGMPEMPASAPGRLRGGIVMTFVSIVLMVLATATGWWPSTADGDNVEVKDAQGASACGILLQGAPAGTIWLQTSRGLLKIKIDAIAQMMPASSC